MSEKRMLIVDAEVAQRVNENRSDLSASEFISILIDGHLKETTSVHNNGNNHVTKEEFRQFEQGIRDLLRSFLEFFLSYGLELSKEPTIENLDQLSEKLKSLGVNTKNA